MAASIGTFVTYVAHKWKKQEWNYDINLVTWSAGVFYGYVTLVPLALYVVLKYFSAPSGLVQLFCLYGYSLFIFIPALVLIFSPSKHLNMIGWDFDIFFTCLSLWQCLSVVPVEIFRWVIAGVAGFMSATFVALNLKAHINSAGERSILIIASIFLLQLGLSVVLKLYLFTVTVWFTKGCIEKVLCRFIHKRFLILSKFLNYLETELHDSISFSDLNLTWFTCRKSCHNNKSICFQMWCSKFIYVCDMTRKNVKKTERTQKNLHYYRVCRSYKSCTDTAIFTGKRWQVFCKIFFWFFYYITPIKTYSKRLYNFVF